ncbi:MAG: DUF4249 domain-containing protein [Reichenbachiella sp.]|uniref:DUF4249 domain-containing protein n=1 Tax=Reichenbachiella sp. TaxID=2184521 RepID=UPI003297DBD2
MIKFKLHIVLVILGLLNLSCIDPIDLDLDSGKTNLVVFGWITNENMAYEIKLARSNGYSDQSGYPPITDAEVFVTDHLNNRHNFIEKENSGIYLSDPALFVGIPGNFYQLTINYNDQVYVSSMEEMPQLGAAEDAFINFISDPAEFEIDENDENFFVTAYIDDDSLTENYYRWKVFVNNELRNLPEELVLFDDRFTNGNKFKFDAANVLFTESDILYFQHMSMTKGAYEYYNAIKDQTSHSTLSPRIQPGIIIGNMSNRDDPNELVLGYFGASEVTTIHVDN